MNIQEYEPKNGWREHAKHKKLIETIQQIAILTGCVILYLVANYFD